jgi:hypothetical protein
MSSRWRRFKREKEKANVYGCTITERADDTRRLQVEVEEANA